jgi:hypothetical protein
MWSHLLLSDSFVSEANERIFIKFHYVFQIINKKKYAIQNNVKAT